MKVSLLPSPTLVPAYSFFLLLLLSLHLSKDLLVVSTAGSSSPQTGNDVMAAVTVMTQEACSRLCWYRKPCSSYSFCSVCSQGAVNCLLHSRYVDDDGSAKPQDGDWEEKDACPPSSPTHVCAPRPCAKDEVCVPVAERSSPPTLCVPQPARCLVTSAPPGARLNASGLVGGFGHQGQVTRVECLPDHVLSPAGADVEVKCQVNSKWTNFKGECIQVNFTNPKTPFTAKLPGEIKPGWGMCLKGTFGNESRARIFLTPESCPKWKWNLCNVTFRVVTRLWITKTVRQLGLFWRREKTATYNWLINGTLPFQPNDAFAYSFELQPQRLLLSIHSRQNYTFPIDTNEPGDVIILEDVTHVHVIESTSLSYVSILEKC
ncbi:hypothetical protein ACOMHN_018627 [Nucella lapillus]